MNPVNPRKSPRAKFIDYDAGLFFVTICTKNKVHYFGEIANGEMHLSKIGEFVNNELDNPGVHYPNISIPLFVVMPNHIHAIIECTVSNRPGDLKKEFPTEQRNPNPMQRTIPDLKRHVPLLSKYIAGMKSAVSRYAHTIDPTFGWQRRCHDHLIRGHHDGDRIAEYIENNVSEWDRDCFYD